MLGYAVLELVGVAGQVDVVEAQNTEEVVDAADVAIGDVGLNGVADLIAEEPVPALRNGESALDDGRADIDV